MCVCFVAPWRSASTCSLKSNDPTLKSSLVEDTHANYFFFMGAYIARPRCRLETRIARINALHPAVRSKISSKLIIFASCVCDTPIARIAGFVSSLRMQVGESPWNYTVACTRVNTVMVTILRAEAIKPVFEGDKI